MRRLLAVLASLATTAAGAALLGPTAAQAAPGANATKRALIIGVTDYQSPTVDTQGGRGDAEATRGLLLRLGWSSANIRMLVDGDATAANIRAGFDWLVAGSTPSSFSVMHYSGHTKQQPLPPGQRDDEGYHEFLWSVDNQFISDRELAARMRELKGRAWVDVAGCEAAGFDDGIAGPTRLFTGASQETEKAYEFSSPGRSVYSQLMVEALAQGASIQKAHAAAVAAAPSITANQRPYGPQTPYMAGGDGSQWFLAPPKQVGPLGGLLPPGLLPPGLLTPQTASR
jgi:caspase domain-containing protein